MTKDIPKNMLKELSRLITVHTGLYFPEKKWNTLNKGLKFVIKDLDTDIAQLFQSLCTAPSHAPSQKILDALTTRLTIGETYFLRDKNFFQILQDHILRGIIEYPKRKTKQIIFWSAGCATGEEPYSLAILIDQMAALLQDWDVTIMASDINPVALNKAEKGIYSSWSMRGTPEKIIKKYFTPMPGNYFEIAPHIRQMVRFCQLNLMNEDYRSSLNCYDVIDVILCCNVLMYFNKPDRTRVLQKQSKLIIDNGWLITGPAESGFVGLPEFSPVRFANALYHRKGPPRKIIKNATSAPHRPKNQSIRQLAPALAEKRAANTRKTRRINDNRIFRSPEKPKYDLYQEALKDYNRGDYAHSVQKLLTIVSKNQNSHNGFLMKTEAMILLAKSYANINELESARTWCEKAIATEKLNPETYYLLSTIFQSDNKINDAVKSLKQSIYLDAEFIMAHFTLGMLQLQKNMPEESRKSMQNALSLLKTKDPDEILPYSEGMTANRLAETIKSMKIQ